MTDYIKAHPLLIATGLKSERTGHTYTRVMHRLANGGKVKTYHVTEGGSATALRINKSQIKAIEAGRYHMRKVDRKINGATYDDYTVVPDREWLIEKATLPHYKACSHHELKTETPDNSDPVDLAVFLLVVAFVAFGIGAVIGGIL